jgi:hypothetical protein
MQIKSLAVSATAFLHLKGPGGAFLYEADEPVGIDLFGPGSPEFSRIEERQSARAIQRMQDNDGKITPVPIAQRRQEEAQDLAALTAGFRHIEVDTLAGAALYEAVYSDPSLGWIKTQAARFVGDWGKFSNRSPTS